MYFVEGPGGDLIPLEGEELEKAREHAWEHIPTEFADAYFDYALADRIELVKFRDYLSSLVWLHRTVNKEVEVIGASHQELRASGAHLVKGWKAESEDALDEEMGLLDDVKTISAGSIIAAATAALETLATDLLDRSDDGPLHKRGLHRKINALIDRWPHLSEPGAIRENVKWVAERRNAFAHSLLDEVQPSWRPRKPFALDNDAVEETFIRVGEVAELLAVAWETHLRATGR